MKRIISVFSFLIIIQSCFCQNKDNSGIRLFFHGIVMDETTFSPVVKAQIMINRVFSSVSDNDGTFAVYVMRNDTVVFKSLGYKSTTMYVSDTLNGRDFIAGIFLTSDTLEIGEVVIIPRVTRLKSEILNAGRKTSVAIENARYNVAISANQGRNTRTQLGDPFSNYELLRQKQKVVAFERGGIPTDQMLSVSPLLLIPVLFHRQPEKPVPLESKITENELYLIQKKFMETIEQRK
jgi:hypothetical protein